MKIAAILIVRGVADEAEHLERCLENITPHVDGVFLNINTKRGVAVAGKITRAINNQIARGANITTIRTYWDDDFAKARNKNLAQVPADYDWIIWLDVDDTVDKPQKIKEVAEFSDKYDAVYVDYDYDHDKYGNPTTVHMVARMFKNNGSHKWKGRIHETLVETRSIAQGMTNDFKVIHHAQEERTAQSFKRNIRMLELQLEDEQKEPDPRTFYYLASTYMDAGEHDSALNLFNDYLQLSGWDQERAVALTKMGRIHLSQGRTTEAKVCFARAISEDPDGPDPWVEMGSLELENENYNKARIWLEHAEQMEVHGTTLERNPLTTTFRCFMLLAECYLHMGGKWLDKAGDYGKKALKYKAKDKDVRAYVKAINSTVSNKHLLEHVVEVYKSLKKEPPKQDLLLQAVPKQLEDNPLIVKLRDKDQDWPAPSICIMTGDTALDAWGPWSLADGIGGSEEAIIRLAPKLAAKGYKVVVFAKPGEKAGLYDGVMWRNFWEANLSDTFDIFVGWRNPAVFDLQIKARKKYLWMHDVMEPGEFTSHRLANLDKVILLSKYHRSLFPMIPDDKVLMSGNGIDPEEFIPPKRIVVKESGEDENAPDYQKQYVEEPVARDPHKILYASSHVRGLAYLYKIWPEVKKAVPDTTLDVYYGRESYDKVHRGNPERMKWMDDMINKAKELEGVTDHGKASQDEIVKAGFRSGLWAYPCPFPEIYCITAIKSQASGAVPVASNYAALDETIQFGHKQPLGEFDDNDLSSYRDALIYWLRNPDEQEKIRPEMMKWARTQSWQAIADQWDGEFNA